jgi:MFS transporter, DHA1 family, tetracycline resistance protein
VIGDRLDFNRVLPVFAIIFVDVLGLTIILPLLHLYAAAYGASPLQIGLVAAAFPLAQLIGVPLMGALSDRFGRKPLLLISQVTTCLSFILLGVANSLLLIILSRVIDGLFGANIATAQAALTDITSDENRAQGLGLTGAAFGLGFIFGPLISIISLEFTDSLAIPALIAACYSFLSILLTIFMFKETLPPEQRGGETERRSFPGPALTLQFLRTPLLGLLLVLMFAQQVIFFGYESLLGLFTLSRLGMLGQGNALVFLVVGVILVAVQVRYIGPWSRKYGERRLVQVSLALLATGLILTALTPEQPHPFYIRRIVERELISAGTASGTEALIGEIAVELPPDGRNGFGGVLWLLAAVVPVAVGAGLIRPGLNSLMTKCVHPRRYGSILGVSASFVSAANAIAPLIGGLLFQHYGTTAPFLLGGLAMGVLAVFSLAALRPPIEQGRQTV